MQPLAQPPRKEDRSFDDWMYRLWKRISAVGGIAWSLIDKTGASLADIPDRQYKDLQYIPTPPVLAFSDGEDGQDGLQGVQGLQGAPGANGTNGTNGLNGVNGLDGIDGEDGISIPGQQGIQGIQGLSGINGENGQIGPSGNDGEDGEVGYIQLQPITTGGSSNFVIDESDITIASNYTITSGKHGLSVSPVTLANGVTVTLPDSTVWAIVS
jgi:hypothetical protein